jgi:hypothetical protein
MCYMRRRVCAWISEVTQTRCVSPWSRPQYWFLNHDIDDISSTMSDFATQYIGIPRLCSAARAEQRISPRSRR